MNADSAPPSTGDVPLLERLCRLLAAEKGYAALGLAEGGVRRVHGALPGYPWRVALVPELAPLARLFERVLVRTDGMTFEVICIRDRLTAPAARYEGGLAPLLEAGRACLAYTGTMHGQKMPVIVRVWEVCAEGRPDVAHLQGLRKSSLRGKVDVSAWSLQPGTGAVWTNARLGGLFHGKRGGGALAARAAAGEAARPAPSGPVGAGGAPVLTYAIAAALTAVFALELAAGDRDAFLSPTVDALIGMGALYRPLLSDPAEWYRLVSAGLLHGGPLHLALNLVALVMGGRFLEPLVGRAWFLVLFTVSLVCGSLASLLLNGAAAVSVGASGAIMGLLAAAFALTFRLPHGAARTHAQVGLVYWLVPALVPLVRVGGHKVDVGAHLGGALAGFALGALVVGRWRRDAPLPPGRIVPRVLSAACALVLLAGAGLAARGERDHARVEALRALLAPSASLKELGALDGAAAVRETAALRERFPRDPRLHFLAGLFAAQGGDAGRAEAELGAALDERELLRAYFSDGRLEAALRVHLAALRLARGAEAEAREVLRPACAQAAEAAPGVLHPDALARLCGAPAP